MPRPLVDEMRRARSYRATDPLRQKLYNVQFLVHARDVDKTWHSAQAAARRLVKESRVPIKESYSLKEHAPPWQLGSLAGHNIVAYEGRFLVVPQALGPVDLSTTSGPLHPAILVFKDEASAREALGGKPKREAFVSPADQNHAAAD